MTDNPADAPESKRIPNPFTELIQSFRALKDAPRAFWQTNYAYWLDGVSYFGMLTMLTMFFHDVAGLSDDTGHKLVSVYMALITGTMLVFGPLSDRLGVRRSLIISVILYIIGRAALPLAPGFLPPGSTSIVVFCLIALVVAAAGNGFMQPSCYAGVRKFTDEKTAAMGYGLLYAGMNLGIVVIGLLSPRIRTGLHIGGIDFDGWGIGGVIWFCVAVRFSFFIFILVPVQTLFAFQFLVMPQYVTRAFSQVVADNMESIVNVVNPLIIVLGVPVITAMTRKVSVYKMMILGSLVSAVPAFIFVLGPKFHYLMVYMVLFSIGEAMWQPRFLQFAAELAPKGRTGAYIAYANIPWFMVKMLAGLYTGSMMERYCPDTGVLNTETMWLVYALVAMISPLGLILAQKWVRKGFATAPPTEPEK
jgi:MFS family permease